MDWFITQSELSLGTLGLLASLAAGLATFVGALPVLFLRTISKNTERVMLGFSAGVMLAAVSFSLIVPGIEAAEEQGYSAWSAALLVGAGIAIGAAFLLSADRLVPHEHFTKGREGAKRDAFRRIWLFVFAIILHNFPEGLAVGVGFAGGDIGKATALAIGIGIQNMPEGLAVAVALISLDYSKGESLFVALLSGLAEPIAALLGVTAVLAAASVLPIGLAFAAGAMLYVISQEIIPETHRAGNNPNATAGLIVGFIIMMCLDVALGA